MKREDWFAVVGAEARPTRLTTSVSEEGEERREWVLRVERTNLEIRWNFFTIRAAKTWNTVPDQVKSRKTVNSFKTAYDNWRENKAGYTAADASSSAISFYRPRVCARACARVCLCMCVYVCACVFE